eukprot:TRINITY_DN112562_c0_g1_i1.p1 TRINITY_DN112562_c0_g1~~TRINITY_DN112562_c0_g1_i1.p1  ORF type:complete len:300 (+),score=68.33 TRINITY_DN112562_c0_g1_i1:85-984(+)
MGFKESAPQLQQALGSSAFPVVLLLCACALVGYRHQTEDPLRDEPLTGFLAMITVHMLPLAALQMKVGHCLDPMGLLAEFAPKVLLSHILFLTPRAFYNIFVLQHTIPIVACCTGLVASIVALTRGFAFRWTQADILRQSDVLLMTAGAILAAFLMECSMAVSDGAAYWRPDVNGHDFGRLWLLINTIHTGSNYTEIIALVPAVRMVFTKDSSIAPENEVADNSKQRQAALFFAFMSGFYLYEDVVQAIMMIWQGLPLAAAAHVVHFLLLIDFVGFFLLHVYNLGAKGGELLRAALCIV